MLLDTQNVPNLKVRAILAASIIALVSAALIVWKKPQKRS